MFYFVIFLFFSVFSITEIEPIQIEQMKSKGVLSSSCPVEFSRLKLLKVTYYNFEGQILQDGELVVLDAAAPFVLEIFKELYALQFPLASIRPLEKYQGQDSISMENNNTYCFSDRMIVGYPKFKSLHAYGLAIDLNPLQNPLVELHFESGQALFTPQEGIRYANRLLKRPEKAFRRGMAEEVVQIFAKHGFRIWGGYWDNPIDYQHFQVPRKLADLLATMEAQDAKQFFSDYVKKPSFLNDLENNFAPERNLCEIYHSNKDLFTKKWEEYKK